MSGDQNVQEQLAEHGAAKPTRAVHTFTLPKKHQNGIETIGLFQLTSDEELMATKRSRNSQHRLVYELVKQALAEIDGTKVGLGDGSADKAWNSMNPKVRTLVMAAFGEIHAPEEDDLEGFLKSQQVSVG